MRCPDRGNHTRRKSRPLGFNEAATDHRAGRERRVAEHDQGRRCFIEHGVLDSVAEATHDLSDRGEPPLVADVVTDQVPLPHAYRYWSLACVATVLRSLRPSAPQATKADSMNPPRDRGGHRFSGAGRRSAEPVVSLDLDVVVAIGDLETLEGILSAHFSVERFPHSLNISTPGSDLRVQIKIDPRYAGFIGRSEPREVLGVTLPVAAREDVLQCKVWAAPILHDARASGRRIWPTSRVFSRSTPACAASSRVRS